jgi:hypothetical protein
MTLFLTIATFLAASSTAFAAGEEDSRAAELSRLRREVETLSSDVAMAKEELRGRLRAIEAQQTEIEVQIRREELRLAQAEGEMEARRSELATHTVRFAGLSPSVKGAIAVLRGVVERGLPYHTADRLAELERIERQTDDGVLAPEAAVARLWAFTEDELRLSRENGLDRQVVPVGGEEVLADVARLGMAALYFQTDGGRSGLARRNAEGWQWTELQDRDSAKRIATLFEKLRHGIRSGAFTLPNPYAGGAR